jgi:hypothetical protein
MSDSVAKGDALFQQAQKKLKVRGQRPGGGLMASLWGARARPRGACSAPSLRALPC